MIVIDDEDTLLAALDGRTTGTSRNIVNRIATTAKASGLWELTCIVVIEPGDTPDDFEGLLGFPPGEGPMGGQVAADSGYWAARRDHGGWVELLIPATDSGFAWMVVVPRGWFDAHIGGSEKGPLIDL